MSDLLNSASLVMIPSGYAEDKVYSVVPSDGSGDLSFTRASNGTRINSAGLVEDCPWNLVTYSEEFNNAVWTTSKYNATVTANDTTAPNGTLTADKVVFTTDGYLYYATSNFSPLEIPKITFSIYSKTSTQSVILGGASISGTDVYSFEDVGNGWYRQSLTRTFNTTSTGYLQILPFGSNVTKYFWGAQLNIGSTAKPYFPTTDRLNVPRLTYQNGGGGCPSLLLEKQSTNLVTYSEQIQNAAWNVIGGDLVVTGNAVISPDGTQNAGAITLANSANRYFVHDPFSITGGVAYTYSVWMKSASGNLSINMGGVNGLVGVLKTVTTEWQRFTYTFTPATTYDEYFGFDNRGAGSSTSGTLYFWGAQVEASSYPTSYIPSTSSSATRVADACFKTGISSLIGTDFTLFFDGYESFGGDYSRYVVLKGSGGTYINYVAIQGDTSNRISCAITDGSGASVFSAVTSSFTNGQRVKIALRCKNNNFAFYANGSLISSQASGSVPTTSDLYLGYYVDYQDNYNVVNQLAIFNQTLTNAELASLTTI